MRLAVNVPIRGRGRRLEETVAALRAYWTGSPPAGDYGAVVIPPALTSHPTPGRPIPVLFGGGGPVSLERAARCGDGWFGAAPGWDGTDEVISSQTVTFRDHWSRLGREPQPIVGVLQPVPGWLADVGKPAAVLRTRFSRYRELGIDQLVLTINWAEPAKAHRLLAAAARAHATL